MDDQTLKSLLDQVDATPSAPPRTLSADDLLAAALRRRRRTSYSKTASAALALVAVSLVALEHMQPATDHRANSITGNAIDIARTDPREAIQKTSHHVDLASRDLAELQREAQMHQQIARAVLASRVAEKAHAQDPAAKAPTTSDADLVRLEAARSAAISWQYANFVEADTNDPAAARREYQRVADRFPGTTWAALATTSAKRLAAPGAAPSL